MSIVECVGLSIAFFSSATSRFPPPLPPAFPFSCPAVIHLLSNAFLLLRLWTATTAMRSKTLLPLYPAVTWRRTETLQTTSDGQRFGVRGAFEHPQAEVKDLLSPLACEEHGCRLDVGHLRPARPTVTDILVKPPPTEHLPGYDSMTIVIDFGAQSKAANKANKENPKPSLIRNETSASGRELADVAGR
ncbi:hypothetical protein DFH09DRAFT_1385802, partial [Mycena vulgaris]